MTDIRYIPQGSVDTARWDSLVCRSPNGNLFGTSVFLDAMTDGWDAIIAGDYEAVLPLPRRTSWGIEYLHTLPFCGPFAVYADTPAAFPATEMLQVIPSRFRRCDLNLWTKAPIPAGWSGIPRINHVLDLSTGYEGIRKGYHASCRNILGRKPAAGLRFDREYPIEGVIQKAVKAGALPGTRGTVHQRISRLYHQLAPLGNAWTAAVTDLQGDPLAGAVFFRSQRQLHYILGWSDLRGRRLNATRHILDDLIRTHAGQPLSLDFEGSDIPGIAAFFESFGATALPYQLLRRDNLPAIARRILHWTSSR